MARRTLTDSVEGSGLIDEVEALLPASTPKKPITETLPKGIVRVPLKNIHRTFSFTPDRRPVRQYYDLEKIKIWAESDLAINGIQSPLWVRPLPGGNPNDLELVAGLRRTLGAEIIEAADVPVIIRNWTDEQSYAAALSENANRQDFSPLEETDNSLNLLAMKLGQPVEEVVQLLRKLYNQERRNPEQNVLFRHELEQIQSVFDFLGQGKWESFTSSRLPLLKLPEDALGAIREGKIQYTKGLAIAKLKDPEARSELLEQSITQSLSLTEIQERVAELATADTDVELSKPRPLKQRFSATVKQLSTVKAWSDPDKAKQLEKLLKQLDKLVSDLSLVEADE